MTTTYETMRDEQIALIAQLTPRSLASVKFDVAQAIDFEEWADENHASSFRRYVINDLFDYEYPESSDSTTEWTTGREELQIAYPKDRRYGAVQRDLGDVIREDLWQIDDALGHRGHGNYTAGVCTERETEIEDFDNVKILRIRYRTNYRRLCGSDTFDAMQNSQEQSFDFTALSSTDSHTVTIPKAMNDTSYVAQITMKDRNAGPTVNVEGYTILTTSTFTLELGANCASGAVFGVIVRDS